MSKTPRPITVAVAGLGRSGWDIHVKAIRDDARYRIVAVTDAQAERRAEAEQAFGCTSFDDYTKMLKNTDAELIVIATPSVLHGPQTIGAFKAGRHVVVEKPISTSVAEADKMIKAGAAARRQLFIHQNYRWFPLQTFIRETLASGKLGKLFHIGYVHHHYSRRNDWQCLSKYAGGVLNNSVTHPLDFVMSLANAKVKDVLTDMKHISDAGNVEDHINLLLRTANGIAIHVDYSTSAATVQQAPEWTFLCTNGSMTVDAGKATLKWFDPKLVKPLKLNAATAVPGRRYGNEDKLPWQQEQVDATVPNQKTFYDSVYETLRERKKFPIPPGQVREMMRVISVCRKQNPQFPGR